MRELGIRENLEREYLECENLESERRIRMFIHCLLSPHINMTLAVALFTATTAVLLQMICSHRVLLSLSLSLSSPLALSVLLSLTHSPAISRLLSLSRSLFRTRMCSRALSLSLFDFFALFYLLSSCLPHSCSRRN